MTTYAVPPKTNRIDVFPNCYSAYSGKMVSMLKVYPEFWEIGRPTPLIDIPEFPVGTFDVEAFLNELESNGWIVRRWRRADNQELVGARAFLGNSRPVRSTSEVQGLRKRLNDEVERNGRIIGKFTMTSGVDPMGLELFYDL
jgi:hypothetical protein